MDAVPSRAEGGYAAVATLSVRRRDRLQHPADELRRGKGGGIRFRRRPDADLSFKLPLTIMTKNLPFLRKSQQRVLRHCNDLLAANDLDPEQRRRLERLAQEALAELDADSATQ